MLLANWVASGSWRDQGHDCPRPKWLTCTIYCGKCSDITRRIESQWMKYYNILGYAEINQAWELGRIRFVAQPFHSGLLESLWDISTYS